MEFELLIRDVFLLVRKNPKLQRQDPEAHKIHERRREIQRKLSTLDKYAQRNDYLQWVQHMRDRLHTTRMRFPKDASDEFLDGYDAACRAFAEHWLGADMVAQLDRLKPSKVERAGWGTGDRRPGRY